MSSWRSDSNWCKEDFSISSDKLVDVFSHVYGLLEVLVRLCQARVQDDTQELDTDLVPSLEFGPCHHILIIMSIILGPDILIVEYPAMVQELHDVDPTCLIAVESRVVPCLLSDSSSTNVVGPC